MGEFIDTAKGKVKEAAGDLTSNKELKREGESDELKGKLKGVVKDLKKDLKHPVKDATKIRSERQESSDGVKGGTL
jgi:uncharacterized protein YjbJ (UPF0337 family)